MSLSLILIGTTIYIVINLYLWSLRQSPLELFLETAPLAIGFCVGFFWWLIRSANSSSLTAISSRNAIISAAPMKPVTASDIDAFSGTLRHGPPCVNAASLARRARVVVVTITVQDGNRAPEWSAAWTSVGANRPDKTAGEEKSCLD